MPKAPLFLRDFDWNVFPACLILTEISQVACIPVLIASDKQARQLAA
jgi:hypothetical protein